MPYKGRRAERPTVGWSGSLPSLAVLVCALLAGLALCFVPVVANAQISGSPVLQRAARALVRGRYDEVDALVRNLDGRDPSVVALKARALVAHGRYAEAESQLKPAADRSPASHAALELGLLLRMLGRANSGAMLERVAAAGDSATDATGRARAARALRALGRFQQANAAYRDAAASASSDPAIDTEWGELFFEKYNKPEAVRSFQAALRADPEWTPAVLGMALALGDDNPPEAIALAHRALELNPSYVAAQVFLADQAADAGRHDEARQWLKKALAVNPSSLEAHARLAALAYVEDKPSEFEAEIAAALAIAPTYGEAYRVAGDFASHNYRFDEAVVLTRRALALDPGNNRAFADLGIHLLRAGDEPGARAALDASFDRDPYDVVTFNLLGLMDRLEKFATVRDGNLVLKMHQDEAPVLQEQAVALAHQALAALAARYEFTPRGPILVEIFPRHDDFAVRNVGLPGMIGALGACFGRVVTMDSPKARPPGTFQWEATLWHELAHVVTLQMSNQRVPRWLTEGISVSEEKRARREWGRTMDIEFAGLLGRGGVLKLRDLNAGFTDPKTIELAYYQASLLVEYLSTTFGDAGVRRLLSAYAKGLDTDAALKSALGTDFEQLQTGFDQSVERQFASVRRALAGPDEASLMAASLQDLRSLASLNRGSYPVHLALGRALLRAGEIDEAMQAFERAAALVPTAAGKGSPYAEMAGIALEKKDRTRAIAELQRLLAVDFDNLAAARQLAVLLQEAGVRDPGQLRPVYQRIAAIDPYDAEAHGALGRLALQRNEPENAAREFRTVLALRPVDEATARCDLAESYLAGGRRADAKKQVLAALEIAPTFERAQALLLKLVEESR